MTKDELVDHAVGACVPVDTGEWGRCQTHAVGWAPAAFHTGRCWAVERQIKAIDTVLDDLAGQVRLLDQFPWVDGPERRLMVLIDDVLDLLTGSST